MLVLKQAQGILPHFFFPNIISTCNNKTCLLITVLYIISCLYLIYLLPSLTFPVLKGSFSFGKAVSGCEKWISP